MVDACIRWTRGMRASKEVATRIATLYQGTSLPQSHPREYATPAVAPPMSSHSTVSADRAMFSSALESSIDAYWSVEVAFTRSFDAHLQSQFQPGLTKLLLRSDVTADSALVRHAAPDSHSGLFGCPYDFFVLVALTRLRAVVSSRLASFPIRSFVCPLQSTPTRRTHPSHPRSRASNPCLSPAFCRTSKPTAR